MVGDVSPYIAMRRLGLPHLSRLIITSDDTDKVSRDGMALRIADANAGRVAISQVDVAARRARHGCPCWGTDAL